MRAPATALLLLPLLLGLVACRARGDRDDPSAAQLAAAEAEDEEPPLGPRAKNLLALEPGRVIWFEGEGPQGSQRVALFAAKGVQDTLSFETLGLGKGGLRFLVRRRGLWVLPLGGGVGHHRIYHERQGARGRATEVTTPAGRYQALCLDHEEGQVSLSHWFVPGKGLVRLVLHLGGAQTMELVRCAEATWGRPLTEPAPAATPRQTWESLQTALLHLDVSTLSTLIGEDLWERLRPAGLDLAQAGAEPERIKREPADAIRAVIPQLLDVRFTPSGPWQSATPDEARAPAKIVANLEGERLEGEATLIQARGRDGRWRWTGFER